MRKLIFFLCSLAIACAHDSPVRSEVHNVARTLATDVVDGTDASTWTEYRSTHFVVDTDDSADRAAHLIERLETLQVLDLKALVGGGVDIPGTLRVVALAHDVEFRDLDGADYAAWYLEEGRFGDPLIVLPMSLVDGAPETLAHELSHHLSRFLFPEQPAWFSEGLAEFTQTLAGRPQAAPDPALGSHLVRSHLAARHSAGLIPDGLKKWDSSIAPIPVRKLFAWTGPEDRDVFGLFHASSWLLYHWLWNQRGPQLSRFQKLLSDGEAPAAAWRKAFPEFDPDAPAASATLDELDATLDRYRRELRFVSWPLDGTGDGRFTARPLPAADAKLILLDVRWKWPAAPAARKALVEREMAEALREDPRNPVAAMYPILQANPKPDLQQLRDVVARAPEDWRGWLLLSRAAGDAEKEAALRRTVQLNPDNASAQNDLAWLLAISNRAHEALPIANRALDLAPWDASAVDTLAEIAVRLGQCPQALQLEARAMSMSAARADALQRQAEVKRRCPQH